MADFDYDEDGVLGDAEPIETNARDADASTDNSNKKEPKPVKSTTMSGLSLDTWIILCSLTAMVLTIFGAFLYGVGCGAIVLLVFRYLGWAAMIGGIVVYVVQLLQTKNIAFTPALVIMILGILIVFSGIYF